MVINFTGGDTWLPSLRCLKRGGKLLVCGATAGHDPKEDLRYVWSFELKIIGSNSFYDDDLTGLMELIAERQDQAGDRQGAAARRGQGGPAADPGPRGDRQGGGDAVSDTSTGVMAVLVTAIQYLCDAAEAWMAGIKSGP